MTEPETPPLPEAAPALSRDSKAGYRPALDGIRAVAVLAVIAYHFGYGWAPGGFLGVDVFFVLSGYLITSLLLGEHARTGRIDLPTFWFRRARRLLPALLVMLVGVAVWIGLTASPFEQPMRRGDLLWTLFYGSNWHFILSGQDYFAQYASASPLRHTWSLAIEEQFYIVWPLVVGAALWFGRRRPTILALVCAVGIVVSALAMALLYTSSDPSRAYYGTDARMHQLLIGALLAVLLRGPVLAGRFGGAASLAAPIAAAVLLVAFVTVRDQGAAYYKGLSVVLAITTAILVWAVEQRPGQPVARVLSLAPVAWVGQLSYGLYLWHWPVILMITAAPAALAGLPGAMTGLNLTRLVVTFAIVIASYYLIEQPIRRGRMPVVGQSARRFTMATAGAIVAVSGTILLSTNGATPALAGTEVPDCPEFTICVRHKGEPGAPVVALIGDSMARSLDPAFEALAVEHGWTYVLQASNSCRVSSLRPAVKGEQDADQLARCYADTPRLQQQLREMWQPDVVVVADLMEGLDVQGPDGTAHARGSERAIALSEVALADAVANFTDRNARVALLKLPPRLEPDCARPGEQDSKRCSLLVATTLSGPQSKYDAMFDRLAAANPGISTMSITDAVCQDGICRPLAGGVLLRYDGVHFTGPGAMTLVPSLRAQLEALVQDR